MYKFTVKCKGAKAVVGEFLGWHQLEQLISLQCNESVWEWFNSLIATYHIIELPTQHLVTVASNGMTVVYSVEQE
jgi:hypothetical protein